MLSHKNLLSNAQSLSEAWRFTSDDRLLHALPIFHAHGLFVAVNVSLNVGASMIFLPKFDIDVVMDKIGSATTMMGVPTFYTRMLADARCTPKIWATCACLCQAARRCWRKHTASLRPRRVNVSLNVTA